MLNVFISHASADRDLASKFVDLLLLGVGLQRHQIFFSIYPGSIPNGEYFAKRILKELNESNMVIAILGRTSRVSFVLQKREWHWLGRKRQMRSFIRS